MAYIADPTSAPVYGTVGAVWNGGSGQYGTYLIAYTYDNGVGETLLSPTYSHDQESGNAVYFQGGSGTCDWYASEGPGSSVMRRFGQTTNGYSPYFQAAPTGGVLAPTSNTTAGAVAPTVTSFLPTGVIPTTSLVITGTGFTGATAVSIGGVAATSFTVDSSTQITAVVPANVVAGVVSVTTPSGTGNSSGSVTLNKWKRNTTGSTKALKIRAGDSPIKTTVNAALANNAYADVNAAVGSASHFFTYWE